MTAFLMVRAEVGEADRKAFDRWYEDEHLPDAVQAFQARAASRGWSDVDPGVHYAFYEFEDLESVRSISDSDAIRALIAEFDRRWEGRVTRARDVFERIQSIGK